MCKNRGIWCRADDAEDQDDGDGDDDVLVCVTARKTKKRLRTGDWKGSVRWYMTTNPKHEGVGVGGGDLAGVEEVDTRVETLSPVTLVRVGVGVGGRGECDAREGREIYGGCPLSSRPSALETEVM